MVVTASTRPVNATVEAVEVDHIDDIVDLQAVDARIVAEDGAIPAGSDDLDAWRLDVMKARFRERFQDTEDLVVNELGVGSGVDVDAFLAEYGVATAAGFVDLLQERGHSLRVAMDIVIEPEAAFRNVDFEVPLSVKVDEDPVARLRETVEEIQVARGGWAGRGSGACPRRARKRRTTCRSFWSFPSRVLMTATFLSRPARLREGRASSSGSGVWRNLDGGCNPLGSPWLPCENGDEWM